MSKGARQSPRVMCSTAGAVVEAADRAEKGALAGRQAWEEMWEMAESSV